MSNSQPLYATTNTMFQHEKIQTQLKVIYFLLCKSEVKYRPEIFD